MPPLKFQSHSCQHCHVFGVDLTRTSGERDEQAVYYGGSRSNRKPDICSPFMTLGEIRVAAEDGCDFCGMLLGIQCLFEWGEDEAKGAFFKSRKIVFSLEYGYTQVMQIERNLKFADVQNTWGDLHDLPIFSSNIAFATFPCFVEKEWSMVAGSMRDSEIRHLKTLVRLDKSISNFYRASGMHLMLPIAENDDRIAQCVTNRPVEDHAGSEDNFTRMKHWLQTCLQHHPKCKIDSGNAYTPTRLMRICKTDNGDLKLKLVRTRSETEETAYVALSYCWGGDQALKCTQANLQALERDVPLRSLPRTLRDAVEVCRRLHVAYMWVDALCIIQDDEVSKLAEVGNMAQVYKNALFTICASSASSTTEGFLNYRGSPFRDPITFRVPFRNESGAETSVDLVIEDHKSFEPEPLRDRGWALQEQLLSRRRLMFTRYQLYWSCASLPPGKKWIDGFKASPLMGLGLTVVTDIARPFVADDGLSQEVWKQEALDSWQTLVSDYVARKLSLEEDRPLAILGIAAEFMQLFGGETYWCGMWQSSFPGCLLWRRYSTRLDHEPISTKRLPSWSWTSQNTHDLFSANLVFGSDVVREARTTDFGPTNSLQQSPRGLHLNGQIWIEGRLLKDAVLQYSRYRTVLKDEVLGEAAGEVSSNNSIWFDNKSDELAMRPPKNRGPGKSNLQPMTLLEIRNVWEHNGIVRFNIDGLVLRTQNNPERPGTYERIGCFSRSITVFELDSDDSVVKAWLEKVVVPEHHPFGGADVAKILLV
ncbi:Putative heterokaryon incompatibility [Colletotrichum destructivum]|uniref:Heterokaryon incompatibility n=1 Tax=Colletotrichum destructivum TaxID=34406 RepID=A0AAX4IRX1_9PEZI|nr:Putative heterokaryon incompatibility [Colletotrichum destructivum]